MKIIIIQYTNVSDFMARVIRDSLVIVQSKEEIISSYTLWLRPGSSSHVNIRYVFHCALFSPHIIIPLIGCRSKYITLQTVQRFATGQGTVLYILMLYHRLNCVYLISGTMFLSLKTYFCGSRPRGLYEVIQKIYTLVIQQLFSFFYKTCLALVFFWLYLSNWQWEPI